MATYLLDNASAAAEERLSRLEDVLDPGTFRTLEATGVGPGWHCLEVGAGAGSIAIWLTARVGADGRVVATDIDPRYIEPLDDALPNLEVRRHDITVDPLPESSFHLVHARLVLEHLPGRELALQRMAAALRPGGWLVIESIDFGSEAPDPALNSEQAGLFMHWHEARTRLFAEREFDLTFARGLERRFRTLGLEDVVSEGWTSTWWGGAAGGDVWRGSVAQLSEPLVAGGYLDPNDADRLTALFADPSFAATSPLIVAAVGRRPHL